MAMMEGTDPSKKLESTYFSALSRNWMVWPAVQAINFKFVPLDYRVLVVNVVSLGELSPPRQFDRGDEWRILLMCFFALQDGTATLASSTAEEARITRTSRRSVKTSRDGRRL